VRGDYAAPETRTKEEGMDRETQRLDEARGHVLDRMETGRKMVSYGTFVAGLLELAMLAACIMLVDWGDRTQVLLFLIFILSYFILVLGMLALAGHITSANARVLAALEARSDAPS
jgi:hypothetical protein